MTVYLGPPEASPVVEVESSPSPTRTVPVPRIVPPVPVAPVVVPPVAAMTPLMQARRGTTCYQLPTQDIQPIDLSSNPCWIASHEGTSGWCKHSSIVRVAQLQRHAGPNSALQSWRLRLMASHPACCSVGSIEMVRFVSSQHFD